jgi:uncharacterized damage-inducible protein DinB
MTLGELLSDDLRRALRGEAWHGASVQELIAPLSAEEAMQRPLPAAHNIWELVVHLTSWSNIVLRRINGGQVEPYEGEDWPEVHDFTEAHWSRAREALAESYEKLSEQVLGMTDRELSEKAPKSSHTVAGVITGLAQHTSYHGGQIAILRKAVTTQHRRAAL